MTDMRPGSRSFLRNVWRRRPLLIREAVPIDARKSLTFDRFRAWCSAPLPARIFVRTEHEAKGTAQARQLTHPCDGLALYDNFIARNEPITLLLNRAESVDAILPKLQAHFGIPYDWRRGNTVATLSAPGAGIGYHAGSEDGFIVQIQGERNWSIWSPDVLSPQYRNFICGSPIEPAVETRPEKAPLLSARLRPGDALYVPALFPHEGITLTESISLSLAWRGLSVYQIFVEIYEMNHQCRKPMIAPIQETTLYRLLDDPPVGVECEMFLCSQLRKSFSTLPVELAPSEEQLRTYVKAIL
jgi:50S ribosomal protein L16 3-hydroxylase